MSLFTAFHRGLHDFPLVFRALFKRGYLAKDWNCLSHSFNKPKKEDCIILVNGPSLKQDIKLVLAKPDHTSDIMCVNYTALSDVFFQVKPNLYAIADPMFWRNDTTQEFTDKNTILFDTLRSANWRITFLVPEEGVKEIRRKVGDFHDFVTIPVNMAPLKNENMLLSMLDRMICTPQFGNVLILSLYYAIMSKYKNISVYGADFDVFKQLQTDQVTNIVYSGGTHFYDRSHKSEPIKYLNRPRKMMHVRLEQTRIAFHQIYILSALAKRKNVHLLNKSSFSLIDSLNR